MSDRWPSDPADFFAMDPAQRADWLLGELAVATDGQRGENLILARLAQWFPPLHNFVPMPPGQTTAAMRQRDRAADDALRDAYQQLMNQGLVAPDGRSGTTFCRITQAGHDHLGALNQPERDRISFARRALAVDLHPALQRHSVEAHFRQGKYETALRDGATFLEDQIRTLGNLPQSTIGVTLASQAFAKHGPLTDPNAHPGEQTGQQRLFEGFFGAVRNVVAHSNYRYADPKEALQLLMLLDLLAGKLDAAAQRLGKQLN